MRKILAALAITAAILTPAHAVEKIASWPTVSRKWEISAWSNESCMATIKYDNGRLLMLTFSDDGWKLALTGLNVVPGVQYDFRIIAGNTRWHLTGTAANSEIISTGPLKMEVASDLRRAKSIVIENIDHLDMYGSAEAIDKAIECYLRFKAI